MDIGKEALEARKCKEMISHRDPGKSTTLCTPCSGPSETDLRLPISRTVRE